MAKHKTRDEWIRLFNRYEQDDWDWDEFTSTIIKYKPLENSVNRNSTQSYGLANSRNRFINKYKSGKVLDNKFMKKKNNRSVKEVKNFIKELTREELEEIARVHITKIDDKKKDASNYKGISKAKIAFIIGVHRTTLYKVSVKRKYKYNHLEKMVKEIWYEHKCIYGRKRLSMQLKRVGINLDERTLGRYMNRWGMKTRTRVAKRRSESKNTNVKFPNIVNRNYNPVDDNIIATDVTYIPAKVKANNVYLSVAISHKTKLIESGKLSKTNDNELVVDTFKNFGRTDFILHSDHGSQYSSAYTLSRLKHLNITSSMSRVGNSLDNREVEYFFGCLKGEFLKQKRTHLMGFNEIKHNISEYIDGYNNKRIQERLHGKTPTEVSVYAA